MVVGWRAVRGGKEPTARTRAKRGGQRLAAVALVAIAAGCGSLLGLDEDVRRLGPDGQPPATGCKLPSQCDDQNPCTTDHCDAADGACFHLELDGGPAPESEQIRGDCALLYCTAGAPVTQIDLGDVPDDGLTCTAGTCGLDGPRQIPLPAGSPCNDGGGKKCDGLGTCVECLSNDDCAPPLSCGGAGVVNDCGCIPFGCPQLGLTCGAVADGCGGVVGCNDAVRNGSESDVDCGGDPTSCPTRCADGRSCLAGGDCMSTFCAGGVCGPAWSNAPVSGGLQAARGIAATPDGGVVVVGDVEGQVAFGTTVFSTKPGVSQIFALALDAEGKPAWVRFLGGGGAAKAAGVAVDGAGAVVVVGSFVGKLEIAGLTLGGDSVLPRAFVVKLDAVGNPLWGWAPSDPGGGAGPSTASAVATGPGGKVVVAGSFAQSILAGTQLLASVGAEDLFVVELSNAGVQQSARRYGGKGTDLPRAVAVDGSGVALAGDFTDTIGFGGPTLESAGDWDAFLVLFSHDATHVFSRRIGGSGAQHARGVAFDGAGGILVVGDHEGTTDLGGDKLTSQGKEDIFVARYDLVGVPLWAKGYGDAQTQQAAAVAVDQHGQLVVGGTFAGSIDFGPKKEDAAGGFDALVFKLDLSGNLIWAEGYGDVEQQSCADVDVTPFGAVVLAGEFRGTINFGQGPLVSGSDGDSVFVAALSP
jgi:hypothetical protein